MDEVEKKVRSMMSDPNYYYKVKESYDDIVFDYNNKRVSIYYDRNKRKFCCYYYEIDKYNDIIRSSKKIIF